MNLRGFAKDVFNRSLVKDLSALVVTAAVSGIVAKALTDYIPVTRKFKLASLGGGFASMTIAPRLQPAIDKKIDEWFDRREAAQQY